MSNCDIILATVNARYAHTAFGLRYLWANLGALRERAVIREFTLDRPPFDIVEALLRDEPRIVGFGVYIWNVSILTSVVKALKAVRPDIVVVLGGPEVSHEYEHTEIFGAADYLIRGEGDAAFAALAQALLDGHPPTEKVLGPEWPDLNALQLPYEAYTDDDLARRVVYVEASRGCPFRCEFCLSSLEKQVRDFPLEPFLAALERLMERGARQFRFIDRTFNLRKDRVEAILDFFLRRWTEDLRVHFEIVPDRLAPEMLEWIARFPAGTLHLEVGIQTFNPAAQAAISRRQDLDRTEENLRFLRHQAGALLHADLIAGLPEEPWESFGEGFNRLLAMEPQEIQVGILKRLKGTPIARHAEKGDLAFSDEPPYEVLQTRWLDFEQLQRIKRFARYFDLYYNSGNFPTSLPLLWRSGDSAFDVFMRLTDSLWTGTGRRHELPLPKLALHLYDFLVAAGIDTPEAIAEALRSDYHRLPGRKDKLEFPKPVKKSEADQPRRTRSVGGGQKSFDRMDRI
jgi:radical SAM superfamily enzyme YgiQ (UPF0313 family)